MPKPPASASPKMKTGLAELVVQEHVATICVLRGVAHYHTNRSDRSERGFLDSMCIGPGGPLVIECKDDDGKTTAEQDLWIWLWRSLGIRVILVRPEDTKNRADLGGKTLIQVEIEKIARGPGGTRFPPHIVDALKKSRSAAHRQLAAQQIRNARAKARRT